MLTLYQAYSTDEGMSSTSVNMFNDWEVDVVVVVCVCVC